jgi:hypothetical protein
MDFRVDRSEFDPDSGRCQYYVAFKPHLNRDEEEVRTRVPIRAAISLSETGDIADLSFELPKKFRTEQALAFIAKSEAARTVEGHVFIAMPDLSGDAVLQAPAQLEVDSAGRIIGMEIQ